MYSVVHWAEAEPLGAGLAPQARATAPKTGMLAVLVELGIVEAGHPPILALAGASNPLPASGLRA